MYQRTGRKKTDLCQARNNCRHRSAQFLLYKMEQTKAVCIGTSYHVLSLLPELSSLFLHLIDFPARSTPSLASPRLFYYLLAVMLLSQFTGVHYRGLMLHVTVSTFSLFFCQNYHSDMLDSLKLLLLTLKLRQKSRQKKKKKKLQDFWLLCSRNQAERFTTS